MKFYKCNICGNFVQMIDDSSFPMSCCGQNMTIILPGISDGALEKHVPVYLEKDNKVIVEVGEVHHPMLDAHYIEWVLVETDKGAHRINLKPGDEPKVEFNLADGEKLLKIYAYCNLHGLYELVIQ